MSSAIGNFIDDGADGKSDVSVDSGDTNKSPNGSFESEILNGYETYEPGNDTEKIGATNGDTGNIRRTKAGRIDRRTKAGRTTGVASEEGAIHLGSSKVSLTDLLLSLHQMGASFFDVAELELDKDEAKKLSDSIQNVSKYYAVNFNPKHVAIAELAVIAGGIYGVRFVAIKRRLDKEKQKGKMTVLPGGTASSQTFDPPKVSNRKLGEMSPSELWSQSGEM